MTNVFKKIGLGVGILVALLIMFLLGLTIFHRISLMAEQERIIPNGNMVEVNGHLMHVYIEGENKEAPLLVFLSGSGTAAPVYDFKPLYTLLSGEYRIAVVEKFGYGYSEIVNVARDIDSILSDTRTALYLLDETGPYVLFPHSLSGLEALRWAQLYPDEVVGIIGIDMALPSAYIELEDMLSSTINLMSFLRLLSWMGLQRLPFVMPVSDLALTGEEHAQARLLTYRNSINSVIIAEGSAVLSNANIVEQAGIPDLPILLLVAKNSEIEVGPFWIQLQEEFARQNGAQIEILDGGHYLHHYRPEQIAVLSRHFIEGLIG